MAAQSAADIINATIATVTTVATEAAAAAVQAATTKGPTFMVQVKEQSAAALAMEPIISHVGDGIFLQTKTAQGIAGAFVWVALFLTCQQVSIYTDRILSELEYFKIDFVIHCKTVNPFKISL